jgi:DNA-binding MltR family transcriptional regulator
MAKTAMGPPDSNSLGKALARFTKQADRGAALVAAAWVDDCLKECVRRTFRPDAKAVSALLDVDRPLGTFSSRVKLVYLLDIIDPWAYRDLEALRRLRNDFAHARDDLRFSTPGIKDRCRAFHAVKAARLGGWRIASAKQQYLVTAYFLATYLLDTTARKRDPRLDQADFYGPWIRRTVKSRVLQLVAEAVRVGS